MLRTFINSEEGAKHTIMNAPTRRGAGGGREER